MPKAGDVVCDRESFIAWSRGELLMRRGSKVIVGDRPECRAAEKALKKGRVVLLTVNGRLVSQMRLDKKLDAYVEEEIDAAST